MIIFDSLKIKLEHKPLTGKRTDYQSSGYNDDDRALVLVSDDINALDNFVEKHSKNPISVGDLLKDLQSCEGVFIGECYRSDLNDHKIVGYKGGYQYIYALYPSILRAMNKKTKLNIAVEEIPSLSEISEDIFKT